MPHIEDILLNALAQDGDKYVFGAAPDFADPNPREFDCSGLVEWACARSKVNPILPHSAFMQAQLCIRNHLEISVDDAVATRGALLFKFLDGSKQPITDVMALTTRPNSAHVAWSLGNGSTIEAAGTEWGVGRFSSAPAKRKWTHGGLLPGVDYVQRPQPQQPTNDQEEEEMTKVAFYKAAANGEVHAYLVTGGIGKHLNKDALALHTFLQIPTAGSAAQPLGQEWQDGVALLDGPLQNVGTIS